MNASPLPLLILAPITLPEAIASYPYALTLVGEPKNVDPDTIPAYETDKGIMSEQRFTRYLDFSYRHPNGPTYLARFAWDDANKRWSLTAD